MTDTTGCTIAQRWSQLCSKRTSYMRRCEKYAEWTLPWLFASDSVAESTSMQSLVSSYGSIGARCVNHISNRLAEVLFPATRPFFRARMGDKVVQFALQNGISQEQLDASLSKIETTSMQSTHVATHRAKSTETTKLLTVTGNALLHYTKDELDGSLVPVVYSLKNYCCVRSRTGMLRELITRDTKMFSTLTEEVKTALRAIGEQQDDGEVHLYTHIKYDGEKKLYKIKQGVDSVDLQKESVIAPGLLPWVVLTWNRLDGEHYGRGLVEDYEKDFTAYAAFTEAQTKLVAMMADVKRLMRNQCAIDPIAFDSAPPGTTFQCEPGDIFYAEMSGKQFDMAALSSKIQQIEQRLSGAFLMTSASVRQAERVTAEEIKMQIRELETALGGVYSKLAVEWQLPLARLLLASSGIDPGLDITPLIITGIDAMSRTAETEAMYMVFQDLQVLANLGPMARWIDEGKYLQQCCANRGVDRDKVFRSAEEVQAMDAQQQQDAMRMQEQAEQAELTKAALKETS